MHPTSTVAFFRRLWITLVDGVKYPQVETYCTFPRLLFLRQRPIYRVWKTEEIGSRKGHAERESKPSLLTLMSWPLLFLHRFLRLLLHNSGKLAIHNDHMLLLIHILHLVLFKYPQSQGNLIISGDIRVVFWWARDGNLCLSFLRGADLPFFRNVFVAIYFRPISDHQFRKVVLLVL